MSKNFTICSSNACHNYYQRKIVCLAVHFVCCNHQM
uniref:Uncharacterized protein n=1 Tax=Arundo donax TaxID=35708 RepID=A0A0A9BPX5_ARUDO